jgi:hypothetical protein
MKSVHSSSLLISPLLSASSLLLVLLNLLLSLSLIVRYQGDSRRRMRGEKAKKEREEKEKERGEKERGGRERERERERERDHCVPRHSSMTAVSSPLPTMIHHTIIHGPVSRSCELLLHPHFFDHSRAHRPLTFVLGFLDPYRPHPPSALRKSSIQSLL